MTHEAQDERESANPRAPATELEDRMTDSPLGTGQQTGTQDGRTPSTAASDAGSQGQSAEERLMAVLAEDRKERAAANQRLQTLLGMVNKRAEEVLRTTRTPGARSVTQDGENYDDDEPQQRGDARQARQESVPDQRYIRLAEQTAVANFKLDNPDWQEHWSDMMELINDPLRSRSVASWVEPGVPDFDAVLANARRDVENRKLREFKAQIDKDKAENATRLAQQRAIHQRQAGIIGAGASETLDELDFSQPLTKEQLRQAWKDGQLPVDEDDPPSWAKP